ncbi:hypothetical protein EV210_107232 [Anaerospora hongkongensis]|uniref:Uncharacterized protein n=1 Tax=Anaerospora hongkongensis TaxID=244830 RepID=A0A4R1PWX3_9FIRM|nr:hypothetical protein [Anaerospora hongkongensis]TCL36967.1 hypothetical protein EV210_107232 [Anaerospora hongkongensis]
MTAADITRSDYTLIPGRLRISIKGLKNNRLLACRVITCLAQERGIRSVTANPLTGRALIYFHPNLLTLPDIKQLIARAADPVHSVSLLALKASAFKAPASFDLLPAIYPLATAAALAALLTKRLLFGKSSLSSSPYIVSLAAIATIIGGYPLLQSGFHNMAKKKKLNAELLLFGITLPLLIMRESIAGLSALWLVYMTNFSGQTLKRHTDRHIKQLLRCSNSHSAPAARICQPLPDSTPPFPYKARLLLSLLLAGIVYLAKRNIMSSLAVLVAGCPVTAAISRSSALDAALATAARRGILIKDVHAIELAGQITYDTDQLIIVQGHNALTHTGHTAHIVIVEDDPGKMAELIHLSQQTREVIRQNTVLATWFNTAGMALAALQCLSPVGAGLLLNASTLTVILNSRRLLTDSTLS